MSSSELKFFIDTFIMGHPVQEAQPQIFLSLLSNVDKKPGSCPYKIILIKETVYQPKK